MPNWAQFAASAAFYILTLAATVSGFISPLIAILLAILATLLLIPAIRHHVRRFAQNRRSAGRQVMEPADLLIVGAAGTALFVVIGAIGVIWFLLQPRAPLAAPQPGQATSAQTGQIEGLRGEIQSLRSEIQHLSTQADRGGKAARVVQLEEGIKKNRRSNDRSTQCFADYFSNVYGAAADRYGRT